MAMTIQCEVVSAEERIFSGLVESVVATAALGSLTAASGDALHITVTVTDPVGNTLTLDGYRSRHAPTASL